MGTRQLYWILTGPSFAVYSVCQPIVPCPFTSPNPKCAYNLLKSTKLKSLPSPVQSIGLYQPKRLTTTCPVSKSYPSVSHYLLRRTSQGSRSPPTQKAPSHNSHYASSYRKSSLHLLHLPKVPSTCPGSRASSAKSPFHLPSL